MKPRRPIELPQTRAEVARQRLAQLAASFDAGPGVPGAPGEPADHRAGSEAVGPDALPGPEPGRGPGDAAPLSPRAPGSHRRSSSAAVARPRPELRGAHVRLLATVGVAAGVLLTWWLLAERPRTAEVSTPVSITSRAEQEPAPAASGDAAGAPDPGAAQDVVVDVVGKVRRPGIVTLPVGSRVHEAIEAAGGLEGRVDTTALNLARVLADGEQVLVGVEPVAAAGGLPALPGSTPGGTAAGTPVNLNAATSEQLQTLPGVGPVTAQSILDWRAENGRFGSIDDLLGVSGIGQKTLENLRELVTV